MKLRYFVVVVIFVFSFILRLKADIVSDGSFWLYSQTNQNCKTAQQSCNKKNNSDQPIDYLENLFFQEEAEKQLSNLQCRLSQANSLQLNQKSFTLIGNQYVNVIPQLKVVIKKIKSVSIELINFEPKFNNKKSLCYNIQNLKKQFEDCIQNLKSDEAQLIELRKEKYYLESLEKQLKSQIWNSDTETISSFIDDLLKRDDSELTQEKILPLLNKQIALTQIELKKSIDDIFEQGVKNNKSIVFSNLNQSTKGKLVENWVDSESYNKLLIENKSQFNQLSCQLEGKYTKGRDQLYSSIGAASFLIGGVSLKFLSKVPAIAESALYTQAGRASSYLKTARDLTLFGVDTSMTTKQLYDECVKKHPQLLNKNKCSKELSEIDAQIFQQEQSQSCMTEYFEKAAPVGLYSTVKVIQSLRKIKSKLPIEAVSADSRIETAESLLGHSLTEKQKKIINEAHSIGRGELGADGTAARVGNYTQQQKIKKIRKLRELKNTPSGEELDSPQVRRVLFENSIVGDSQVDSEIFSLSDSISTFKVSTKLSDDEHVKLEKLDEMLMDATSLNDETEKVRIKKLVEDELDKLKNKGTIASTSLQSKQLTVEKIRKINPNSDSLDFEMPDVSGKPLKVTFSKNAFKDYQKADPLVQEQFLNSMINSRDGFGFSEKKIKYLAAVNSGEKGKVVEIRRTGRAHSRLIGCEKNGNISILAYEANIKDATEITVKYKDLCK